MMSLNTNTISDFLHSPGDFINVWREEMNKGQPIPRGQISTEYDSFRDYT